MTHKLWDKMVQKEVRRTSGCFENFGKVRKNFLSDRRISDVAQELDLDTYSK